MSNKTQSITMVISLSEVVFKMSDRHEGTDSNEDPREGEKEENSKYPSLKDATHKLKAEALRRLQLGDVDYESEGAKNSEGSFENDNSNVQDTGVDGDYRGEVQPEKSDGLSTDKYSNVNITDRNGAGSSSEGNKESGSFSQDSAKPDVDKIPGDSVGNVDDVSRRNKQGSNASANEGGKTSSEGKDQSTSVMSNQGEDAKQSVIDETSSKDSRPISAQRRKGASPGFRPSSGGVRPGLGIKGEEKGSQHNPGSRPGTGNDSKSRPGLGSSRPGSGSKRSREEGQSRSRPGSAGGRPGSTGHSRSRRQLGTKQEVTGTLGQDESSGGGVAEGSANIGGVSFEDGVNRFAGVSHPEGGKEEEAGSSGDNKAASSTNIIRGTSQTVGADAVEQGKDHHADTLNSTVNKKSADGTYAQTLSEENKSESKQTEDGDKISDDVSPPMNEGAEVDSKQSSDSVSYDKQDSGDTKDLTDAKEEEHSDSVKGDKEKTRSSDHEGQDEMKSDEHKDASEASQVKDGSVDEKTPESQGEKGKTKEEPTTDPSIDGKPDETQKVEAKEESGTKADSGAGDKSEAEVSVDQQISNSKNSDAAADTGEGKKDDGGDKKKKKKKAKKDGTEQQEDIEEEGGEVEETGEAVGAPQPTKAKQDVSGN